MTRNTWTAEIVFEETLDSTEATITINMGDAACKATGRARRNPQDPNVPLIGEELAAARALAELSHKLVDEAALILEGRVGEPVELSG